MVPLRFIGEAFGATVTWDPVFQIIDINLKGSLVRLQLGTNYASVAGEKVIMQGIPVSMKGVTMVPIRLISEAFGAQVDWIAATQGIDITYPKP
jgi:N-acetylmuramoyl-L-alanine amidase